MKALIVSTEFPPGPGGIGTHSFELARHLARRGWRIAVLAAQDYVTGQEAAQFNETQPFAVFPWRRPAVGPLRPAWRLGTLVRCLSREEPDVVVASGGRAVLLVSIACRRSRTPWVAVAHGTEFGSNRGWMAAALRSAYKTAAAVVCVSEHTRSLMHEFGIAVREVAVIPNGADPERFRVLPEEVVDSVRRELDVPPGRWLVTVGNVTKRKAQDVVVRALPRILESVPEAHYLLVGLPSLATEMRGLAASLGVGDRVHLIGRVDSERLVGILNAAELFVLTSRRTATGDVEGYGIAVVEASLCGKPSVVSGGSGLSEAVAEGQTGLVVPADDPQATAAAVVALLLDEPRRREMGERARRRALDEQTWASRIERYDALLRRSVGTPATAVVAGGAKD